MRKQSRFAHADFGREPTDAQGFQTVRGGDPTRGFQDFTGRPLTVRTAAIGGSDLLICEVDDAADIVACPIEAGDVTFHHSRMPHMTTANVSERWRLVLTQHFRNPLCKDLPENHYPWRVHVSQRSGQRVQQDGRSETLQEKE